MLKKWLSLSEPRSLVSEERQYSRLPACCRNWKQCRESVCGVSLCTTAPAAGTPQRLLPPPSTSLHRGGSPSACSPRPDLSTQRWVPKCLLLPPRPLCTKTGPQAPAPPAPTSLHKDGSQSACSPCPDLSAQRWVPTPSACSPGPRSLHPGRSPAPGTAAWDHPSCGTWLGPHLNSTLTTHSVWPLLHPFHPSS